jgi:hypothetical protein
MASDIPSAAGGVSDSSPEEEAEIERALQKEMRTDAPMTSAGCFWRGALAILAVMVLICGSGYFGFQTWISKHTARRNALIKDLRAKGEPLSADDLTRYTALPEGTEDLTQRYSSILKNYVSQNALARSQREEVLPIVGIKGSGAVPRPGEPWSEEAIAESYLTKRPWLKEAEDLAEVEGEVSFPRDYRGGIGTYLDEIQYSRGLARDLQLQFQMRMRAGDRAGAMRSLRAIFMASRALKHEPIMVSHLVRVAVHNIGAKSAAEMLRDRKATPQEIASIRGMIENDFHAGVVRALKGERAIVLISLSDSNFDRLNGLVGANPDVMAKLPSSASVADLRPGDTAMLLELLTEAVQIAEENDFPEIIQQMKIRENKVKKMQEDEQAAMPWNRHILPGWLTIGAHQSAAAFAGGPSLGSALNAALDVEEKLAALPPGERTKEAEIAAIRAVLPRDPFTGQPMKFLVDDQGYTIYSVGRNGADDAGSDVDPSDDRGVRVERTLAK